MHVITGLATGGAEMMLLKLLSANRASQSIVVSLTDKGTIGPHIAQLGIPVHALGLRRSMPNPFRIMAIRKLLRDFQPQIIQGWMYHGNLMASVAAYRSGKPVLWNIRQSVYDLTQERRLTAWMIRVGASFSRRPAAIIYNSQTSARQHEAIGYDDTKRVLIPNGFDCEVFRPDEDARQAVRQELGIGNSAVLVGLIARYHPMKDHASFLHAAGLVAKAHPSVFFLLAGNGVTVEQPALLKIISEHQLPGRVFLLGERSDMPRLTAALDILCSSSWAEAFSNTIGEAMACAVPCVVTDVGESASIVADTGLVVPPRTPQALAEAISQLIEAGSGRMRQLGEAARGRIEREFSLPVIAQCYERLYSERIKGIYSPDHDSYARAKL